MSNFLINIIRDMIIQILISYRGTLCLPRKRDTIAAQYATAHSRGKIVDNFEFAAKHFLREI